MPNINEFTEPLEINGRAVDKRSLKIARVNPRDYPDFADSYFDRGRYEDGEELSDEDLEYLTDNHYWLLNQMAHDQYHDRVPDNYKDAGLLDEGPGDLGKRSPGERVSTADSILDILTPSQLEKVLRPVTFDQEAMFVDHQDVYDALYDHYVEIPEVDGGMPYGTAKGRTGNPDQWIEERVWADFGDEIEAQFEAMTGQSIDHSMDPPDEFFELRRLAGLPIRESSGLSTAMKRDAKIRDRNIKKTQRWMKQTGKDAEAAVREFDLSPGDVKHLTEDSADVLGESEEMVTKRVVGHEDREARMMQRELLKIRDYAEQLVEMLDDLQDADFPHWWQAKLVKAGDYMSTIKHFLEGEQELDQRGSGEIDHISVDPIAQELMALGESEEGTLSEGPFRNAATRWLTRRKFDRRARDAEAAAHDALDRAGDFDFADPDRSRHDDKFSQEMGRKRRAERAADRLRGDGNPHLRNQQERKRIDQAAAKLGIHDENSLVTKRLNQSNQDPKVVIHLIKKLADTAGVGIETSYRYLHGLPLGHGTEHDDVIEWLATQGVDIYDQYGD